MATYTKNILSSSTDGKSINITATATVGTAIHTGPTTVTSFDEVYLYANNTSTSAVLLSIEWGDATNPIEVSIPPESGPMLVVPGLILKGNATPLTVKAFAGTTAVINITGYVHNITV